ncbi:4Fe-4S binding protein [Thermodesulfobacteriota bacterium]
MKEKKITPKRKNKIEEICCRNISQYLMSLLLPLVIVGGYFRPMLGFTVVGLIAVFLLLAGRRGRFYCGWLCPMGAFHERFLSWISFKRPILPVFKSSWLRWLFFVVMMCLMFTRLIFAWGDVEAVGAVFRMMWIISTSLAILLGIYFKSRIWCTICPMGALQGVVSKNTYLLTVSEDCKQCKKCERVCPISTYPGSFKKEGGTGQVPSIECLRCSNCVLNCPIKALSFHDRLNGAAVD